MGTSKARLYELHVKKIAVEMARCRKLERGGQIRKGWFDARMDMLQALEEAAEDFPGMDFDLMDDAARLLLSRADADRTKKNEVG